METKLSPGEERIRAALDKADKMAASMDPVERVRKVIERDEPLFSLAMPIKITVKLKDGGYRKWAAVGNETFIVKSCYAGKRDLIFICEWASNKPHDVQHVEVSMRDAKKHLKGFAQYIEEELNTSYDLFAQTVQEGILGLANAEAQAIRQSAPAEEQEESKPEMYGSW